MQVKDLIGKALTNIYIKVSHQDGWLDMCECFIELDNELLVDIPFNFDDEVWIKQLEPGVESVFENLADYPVFLINKEGKSIGEIAQAYSSRNNTVLGKLKKLVLGKAMLPKEYIPYKVEYHENQLKNIKYRKIVDIILDKSTDDKVFLELDNGYIITEKNVAPSGTGQAGINYFVSFDALVERNGNNYKRLTDWLKTK